MFSALFSEAAELIRSCLPLGLSLLAFWEG
jgi:hypothetical protein